MISNQKIEEYMSFNSLFFLTDCWYIQTTYSVSTMKREGRRRSIIVVSLDVRLCCTRQGKNVCMDCNRTCSNHYDYI